MKAWTPLALAGLGASPVVLLRRMRKEFDKGGTLTTPTVAAMYATYTGHALLTAGVAHRRTLPLPLPPRPAEAAGAALILTGAGLWVAGVQRFAGSGQVSGTEVGELVSGGVYRYSRNPQYVGYVLALVGLGLARRSAAVLGLATALALVFRWWVPVEERHLDRELGDAYSRYRERTARWFSLASA